MHDDLRRRPRHALDRAGAAAATARTCGVRSEVLLVREIAAQERGLGEAMRLVAAERADVLRLEVHREPAVAARLVELGLAIGRDRAERAMRRDALKGHDFRADREESSAAEDH